MFSNIRISAFLKVLICSIAVVPLIGAKCDSFEAEVSIPDLPKTAEELTRTAEALSKGIDSFDLIGLKTLIDNNEELKKKLAILNTTLVLKTSPGTGKVNLKDRKLQFQITEYKGSFDVKGWVDTEQNWFWDKRLNSKQNAQLALNMESVAKVFMPYAEKYEPGASGRYFGGHPATVNHYNKPTGIGVSTGQKGFSSITKLHNNCQKVVDIDFPIYLQNSPSYTADADAFVDLGERMGESGAHEVVIKITPRETQDDGTWSISGRLVLLNSDNEVVSKFTQFDLDSETNPDSLGQPLDEKRVYLVVETNEA